MPATFDKILGKPLLHSHQASDIIGLTTGSSDTVASYNSNQTLTSSSANIILINALSGAVTIVMPAASTVANKVFSIKKIDTSANQVIVDVDGSEKIDGDANVVISFPESTLQIVSDGSNWYII